MSVPGGMQAHADEMSHKRDMQDLLLTACNLGLLADVEELVEHQECTCNAFDRNGVSALHHAAAKGADDVVRFLISHGADVETEDMDGRTPLHAAAIWGHDEVIRMLAKRNAYLESPEKNDETPLHLAARHAPLSTVKLLVSLGASLKPLTKQGTTVLAEALLRGRMDVAEALVSHGADVNARCNGYTLLQVLLGMGLVDEAKFVMKHGASVAQAGKAMLTPLHSAVLFGGVEGVTALLKHTVPKGGTPVDVNALTATGQTALDLVKSDDAHAKKLTALLKSYKAKAGVDVQADVKRAEAEKAARPFRELSHTEQDRRLRRWAAAEPAMLADEGLGAEACRRFANIKTLERDLEIHTAIATVREDGQFQHLYAEADVRAAVAEIKKDYNFVTKYRDNQRVMYVMNALRKLQNVLRPYKVTISFDDLVGDSSKRAGQALEKMKLTRAAEWEAARAAVRETDETAAVKVADATFKSYLENAIKKEPDAPTAKLAAQVQQQEMARAAKAEAAAGPSRVKTEAEKAAEFEKMLDESQEKFERENPRKTYSTWSEWWGALLYQLFTQTLMMALVFALLYVAKYFGFGPLANFDKMLIDDQQKAAAAAAEEAAGGSALDDAFDEL